MLEEIANFKATTNELQVSYIYQSSLFRISVIFLLSTCQTSLREKERALAQAELLLQSIQVKFFFLP